MKEIVTIFQNYCGSGWYPVLFLAALLYLLVTEKKKQIRVVLVESSLVITVLFFLPFTKTIMNLLLCQPCRRNRFGVFFRLGQIDRNIFLEKWIWKPA